MNKMNTNKNTLFSYFLLAAAVVCFYQLVINLSYILNILKQFYSIISPFVTGFVLAYILNIPCEFIRSKLKKSKSGFLKKNYKTLGILITYLIFISIIYLAIQIIVPSVYQSVLDFVGNFPIYYRNLLSLAERFNLLENLDLELSIESIFQTSNLKFLLNTVGIENIVSSINAFLGVSSVLLKIVVAFISSIYMLMEKERFTEFFDKALKVVCSTKVHKILTTYLHNINKYFKQYIFCQSIDALILGTAVTIEMTLIGSQYALILGIMLGLMNYVPIFGSIVGSVIAVIIIAITENTAMAAVAAVMLIVTQQIDGNLISPKLLGNSFSISPLLIIISITVGGSLAGPVGMIVAIPVIAVLKNITTDILSLLENRKLQKQAEIY